MALWLEAMSTCIQHMVAVSLTTVQCRAVAEGEEVSVQHIFSLVMAPVEGTPRSTVYIRLLGPFSARSALLSHAYTHPPLHSYELLVA